MKKGQLPPFYQLFISRLGGRYGTLYKLYYFLQEEDFRENENIQKSLYTVYSCWFAYFSKTRKRKCFLTSVIRYSQRGAKIETFIGKNDGHFLCFCCSLEPLCCKHCFTMTLMLLLLKGSNNTLFLSILGFEKIVC